MGMDERERVHGQVMSYDINGKGYGFIRPDQHNERRDVYYRRSDLAPGVHNLTPGERCHFIMTRNNEGLRASNIRPEPSVHREIEQPPVDRTDKRSQRYDGNHI
jgi:cold shock CspA family protein